jgi:hypothetical protein
MTLGSLSEWGYAHLLYEFANQLFYARVMLVGVPLVAGLLVGALGLRRPVKGILNAIAIISVPTIVMPVALADLSILNLMPAGVSHLFSTDLGSIMGAFSGFMVIGCWIPFAALGAGIGRRIASRLRCQPLNQVG